MAYGFSPFVWAALNEASPKYIKMDDDKKPVWYSLPDNDFQDRLIALRPEIESMLDAVDSADLKAVAAPTAEIVNKFLTDQGMDIQLDQWDDPDTIGVAAVIKILMRRWIAQVRTGFNFSSGKREDSYILTSRDPSAPTVRIEVVGDQIMTTVPVEGGYEVSLITHTSRPPEGMELCDYWMACRALAEPHEKYTGVMYPSLLLEDIRPDLSALLGMFCIDDDGGKWKLTQVLEQIRFAMGPGGISAVAAVAAAATLEAAFSNPEPEEDIFIFDSPGLWALWKVGKLAPVIVGHFDREDFSPVDVDVFGLKW